MRYTLFICLLSALCCNFAQAQKTKENAKSQTTVGTVKVAKAQNASIKWSEEDKELGVLAYPVLYDKKNIYGFDGRPGSYYAQKSKFKFSRFSSDFKMEKTVNLTTKDPIHKKTCELEYITSIKGQPYFFTSFRNYKKQKNYLFYQKIDKKTLEMDDRTKIAEIDLEKKKKGEDGEFRLRTSSDSSKVLVYYYEPNSKKENQVIGFHVFDSKMNQLWENEVELPYKGEFFTPINYTLDNNGNAYILGKLYNEKLKEAKDGKSNYKFIMIACQDKGERLSEYEIDLDGKFVSESAMKMNDKTGKLICAGYYSNKNSESVKGSFFLSIDPISKKIEQKTMQPFTFEQMMQNTSRETKDKITTKSNKKTKGSARNSGSSNEDKEVELNYITLSRILLRDDGGVVLIGEYEHIYTYTTTSYDGKRWTTTTHTAYIYGDAIVTNVNPEGKIDWSVMVPKYNRSVDDGGALGSFAEAIVGNKIHLIYTDNIKNLTAAPGKNTNAGYSFWRGNKDMIITLATIDTKGNLTREILLDKSSSNNTYIAPRQCNQVGANEMFLVAYKGGFSAKARVGRLTFK